MVGAWQDTADAYLRSFARLCAGTVDEMLRLAGPGGGGRRLLDIGTGPGTVAAAAGRHGHRVIGLDSDRSMIDLAARRNPRIAFGVGALPDLPRRDHAFDVITANFVVNHTPDPRRAVAELYRVTLPGGRLVATIWPARPLPLNQLWAEVLRRAAASPPPGSRLPPDLDFDRSEAGFAGILSRAGFDRVDCAELAWTFEIEPAGLWSAVEAGIGRTYRAQDTAGRAQLRAAYADLTGGADRLRLRSTALIACAVRPH